MSRSVEVEPLAYFEVLDETKNRKKDILQDILFQIETEIFPRVLTSTIGKNVVLVDFANLYMGISNKAFQFSSLFAIIEKHAVRIKKALPPNHASNPKKNINGPYLKYIVDLLLEHISKVPNTTVLYVNFISSQFQDYFIQNSNLLLRHPYVELYDYHPRWENGCSHFIINISCYSLYRRKYKKGMCFNTKNKRKNSAYDVYHEIDDYIVDVLYWLFRLNREQSTANPYPYILSNDRYRGHSTLLKSYFENHKNNIHRKRRKYASLIHFLLPLQKQNEQPQLKTRINYTVSRSPYRVNGKTRRTRTNKRV